jgi:hypothetical protein
MLLACGGAWVACKGPTPAQVEREFRAALPIGTSRAAAESWLKHRGMRFVAVEYMGDAGGGGRVPVSELAGVAGRQVGSTVVAYIEPAFVDLFWEGTVSVFLYFDPDGKLIGCGIWPTVHAL